MKTSVQLNILNGLTKKSKGLTLKIYGFKPSKDERSLRQIERLEKKEE